MDFDYQKIKDTESRLREERMSSLPVHKPRPMPRPSRDSEMQPTTSSKPPVKPQRSIKHRPAQQQGPEELKNLGPQKENEMTVKRIAPALILGPVGPLEALSPSLRAHTLLWFERTQLPRLQVPGRPLPCWLHGFATRREAEQLLQDKPQGCFLLRLSESKIGFVLSYRGEDRCRHFIIEEEGGEASGSVYLIAGENSHHGSLEDLINYYSHNPVGPFNEMLTVPCVQPNRGCEETDRLGMKEQEAERKEGNGQINCEEQMKLPMIPGPAVIDPLPTNSLNQIISAKDVSAQYAAVRKPLKKTFSLPECKCETAPTNIEVERSSNQRITGDEAPPTDAPYARVKKLPKVVSQNIPNASAQSDVQGATATITPPPPFPNLDTIAAEQKYWKLEPMHTYEETPHMRSRPEEIDCYAVGRRRQAAEDSADLRGHHLYSEVNIRGANDGRATPSRPGPSLPSRPPPRSAHGILCPETGQSFGVTPLTTHPQHSGFQQSRPGHSSSSIYEQIPERPTSCRPSLPPPHSKR